MASFKTLSNNFSFFHLIQFSRNRMACIKYTHKKPSMYGSKCIKYGMKEIEEQEQQKCTWQFTLDRLWLTGWRRMESASCVSVWSAHKLFVYTLYRRAYSRSPALCFFVSVARLVAINHLSQFIRHRSTSKSIYCVNVFGSCGVNQQPFNTILWYHTK